jgi:hypothetical protein
MSRAPVSTAVVVHVLGFTQILLCERNDDLPRLYEAKWRPSRQCTYMVGIFQVRNGMAPEGRELTPLSGRVAHADGISIGVSCHTFLDPCYLY